MKSEEGRKIHGQAEHAREKEQDCLKSLHLLEEALIVYEKDNDLRGFSEALQSRSSVYKHLYQQSGNEAFIILAKHDALSGIEIAENLEDKSSLAMVYRGAGKIYEQLKQWEEAAHYFSRAVEAFKNAPPIENNRPAVLSDLNAHYAYNLYKSGDTRSGLHLMQESLSQLENDSTEEKYNRDVWISGAHMRTAEMLVVDNPESSKEHLAKAREIINSNPDLELRSQQLNKLEAFLNAISSNE